MNNAQLPQNMEVGITGKYLSAKRGSHRLSVPDLFFFMTQFFPTFMNFLGFPLPLHFLLGLSGMSSGSDVAAVASFLAVAGRSKPRSCSLASSRSCGFFLGLFLRL